MSDQSGAFPEGLREAPWASLIDVVTAYVSDVAPPGGDSPRAIVLAAIDRLRAALERPRPAPPEKLAHEMFNAELCYKGLEIDVGAKLCALAGFRYDEPYGVDVTFDDYDTSFEFKNTPPTWEPTAEHRAAWWAMGFARCWVCYSDGTETYYAADGTVGKRHAGYAGGSAGTGAAPPDLRDRVRGDWAAGYKAGQESGVPPSPEGANERFERIATEFYQDTGYLRPGKDVPAAVGGESYDRERNAAWKIWNAARVRGGAAQPPPSAPDRCVMCGKIPDSIVSSRNPALTVCRNCWVGVPREETNHE